MPRKLRISVCLLACGLAAGLVAFRSNPEPGEPAPVAAWVAPTPELKPAPSTPIAEEKAVLGDDETWRPEWDATIEKALPDELLSPKMGRKVAQFCPRFSAMSEVDRRAFWAYLFQALAGAEAGLKATADVQHTEAQVAVVDGVSHRMVRASGLLQLTYEDSVRYGCDFDWKADRHLRPHDPKKTILQPDNNLLCGVSILDNQLTVQKKPLFSTSSYWSTLRPDWPGNRVFIKQMRNVPAACGRPRLTKAPKAETTISSSR
jgi:hypothetical protein